MPGTPQEMIALLERWPLNTPIVPRAHRWDDGTTISEQEEGDLMALRLYARRFRDRARRRPAQRKAMRLLRGLLSPGQRQELRRLRHFYVTTPATGTTYRLDPRRGHAERVERHGKRWFVRRSYCLHDADDDDKMPPADVTIGHLLLLLADEEAFLATANETRRDDQLWNRDYLRRMRGRRVPA